MSDSAALLRMLEPTVRPTASPAGRAQAAGKQTFENQSFESLLAQVQQPESNELSTADESQTPPDAPPKPAALPGLGRIENQSILMLLANQNQPIAA